MSNETKQQMTPVDAALMWADDCVKGQKPLGKLFMKRYKECINTLESLRILAAEVRRLREENAKLQVSLQTHCDLMKEEDFS